jgi:DNA-binding NarL/FixJ family response regulator
MTDPIRVLLVDDQELFRSGVAVTIDAQPDLRVVGQAANGRQAVQLTGQTHPDVVLMDLRMPELDGVEATRQICAPSAAAGRARPVRVIVLTTFNLDDRAALAIRYGASGFLLKDATPDFLRAAIRTVHAGQTVLAPNDLSAVLNGSLQTRQALPAVYQTLTAKEREILTAVAQGLSNTEIAAATFTSESTVKTHVGSILRKLDLRDRVQVVVFAHDHGLRR